LSYWFLDLIVHFKDLPLFPGKSPLVGFDLWNSTPWTLVVEGGIFIFGTALYLKATKAKNKIGKIGFWVLILLLVSMYVWSFYAPPPPNVNTFAWSAQLQWIFILLAYWVDKNRTILQKYYSKCLTER
jgi:hypothetical protein